MKTTVWPHIFLLNLTCLLTNPPPPPQTFQWLSVGVVNCILRIFPGNTNWRKTPDSDLFNTQKLIQKMQSFVRSPYQEKETRVEGRGLIRGYFSFYLHAAPSYIHTPWEAFNELILLSSISLHFLVNKALADFKSSITTLGELLECKFVYAFRPGSNCAWLIEYELVEKL